MSKSKSFAESLAAFFRERPGQWIDGRMLEHVAGRYAWRSRVSDIRRAPFKMRIDNRQRRIAKLTPAAPGRAEVQETITISEYCFVPDPPAESPTEETRPHV